MTTNQYIDLFISLALAAFVGFMLIQMKKHQQIINVILAEHLKRDFLLREARYSILVQYLFIPIAVGFALWRFYMLLQSFGAQGAGFYGLVMLCGGYTLYQVFYYVPLMALVKHRHLLGR